MSDRPTPAVRDSTFVVIAAYNEESMLGQVVRAVRREWPRLVVVDDGSNDRTAEVARAAGAEVVRHAVNRGQGAALQTGLTYSLAAGARYLVTFDADGQHRGDEIGRLLEPLVSGRCDVALGSRFLEPGNRVPRVRRLLLKCAVLFTRAVTGLRLTDTHNGFRALTHRAARRIDLRADRMAHASEILDQIAAHRLAWTEVPVTVRYTRHSRGKGQSNLDAVRVLVDYVLSRIFP